MKVNTAADSVVERDGLSSDGQFGIIFNAKMAKILSDGLYSDKISSIIRELSCNAIDSHVEAGKYDLPIEVHLPTIFEPYFHVRDFGTGLDHQQVEKIYTVYGASTKTDSNKFIGQLGLGSKSPFSYVDAFDVTARKSGVERQYSMYKDEKGMPSVALLGERATTEPNGVTVKMPVKQEDMNHFIDKAGKVFQWFEVIPTITGATTMTVPSHDVKYQGNGWQIRKKIDSYYNRDGNRSIALMGRVAYPLHHSSISGLTPAQLAIMQLPLTLVFDIGDLEVAASREAIGYDTRTQDNIRARLDQLLNELGAEFERSIADAETEWEARKMFGGIFSNDGGMRYELEQAFGKKGLVWKNKPIHTAHIDIKTDDIWVDKTLSPRLYTLTSSYKRLRHQEYHHTATFRCSNHTVIVFNDLEKGGQSRVSYLHEETDNHRNEIFYFEDTGSKTVAEVVEMLGNPPYKMSSELPKKPAAVREKIHMLKYIGGSEKTKAWKPVDVDIEDGGIYVMLDRYTVLNGEREVHDFDSMVSEARASGIIGTNDTIYAPRSSMKSKLNKADGWKIFFDAVRDEVSKRLTPAVIQAVADQQEFSSTATQVRDNSLWQFNLNIADTSGPFTRFVNAMRDLEDKNKSASQHKSLIDLARRFGTEVKTVAPIVKTHDLWKEVQARYPMLGITFDRYSSRNINGSNAQIYADYINMVDAYHTVRIDREVAELISA